MCRGGQVQVQKHIPVQQKSPHIHSQVLVYSFESISIYQPLPATSRNTQPTPMSWINIYQGLKSQDFKGKTFFNYWKQDRDASEEVYGSLQASERHKIMVQLTQIKQSFFISTSKQSQVQICRFRCNMVALKAAEIRQKSKETKQAKRKRDAADRQSEFDKVFSMKWNDKKKDEAQRYVQKPGPQEKAKDQPQLPAYFNMSLPQK